MSNYELTFTIINFSLGGALFFLAITAIREDFSNLLNRITGLLFLLAALPAIFWSLSSVIKQHPNSSNPFEESILFNLSYSWELVFPALLIFALTFSGKIPQVKWRRRLTYLVFLPQILHLVAALAFANIDDMIASLIIEDNSGPLDSLLEGVFFKLQYLILNINMLLNKQDKVFPLINSLYAAGAIAVLVGSVRGAYNKTFRRQAQVITVAIAVPALIYTVLYTSEIMFEIDYSSEVQIAAMALALGWFAVGVFWAIIRHQFLDIGLAVRQSVVNTISTGALVGLYLLIIDMVDKWIAELTGGEGLALSMGFVVLALIFFQPLNSQIEIFISRLFLRSRSDFRNIIEVVTRQTVSVFEPAKLRGIIEGSLRERLMVESVYFTLYNDRLGEYVVEANENSPKRYIVDRNDIFLGAIGQLSEPAPIDELEKFKKDSRLSAELETRKIQLLLPLRDADRLLGFIGLTRKVNGAKYTAEEINLLSVLSHQLVSALTNARLYAESVESKRLEEEVAMARQIQIGLLPTSLPAGKGFSLAALSLPSQTVGGDFYDVFTLSDGKIGLVIADASGKGIPAAMVITQIQAMIRSELNNNNTIENTLANVNNYLVALTSPEKFATLCLGIYDTTTSVFEYCNAGHNYPPLIRKDGSHEHLQVGGLIVGAFKDAVYESAKVTLGDDDFIFFFTDGISETMNEEEEEYGEERLLQYLLEIRDSKAEELISKTLEHVNSFYLEDPPKDDRTILVLKTNGLTGELADGTVGK